MRETNDVLVRVSEGGRGGGVAAGLKFVNNLRSEVAVTWQKYVGVSGVGIGLGADSRVCWWGCG